MSRFWKLSAKIWSRYKQTGSVLVLPLFIAKSFLNCDQSLLFFHLINQRFIFALVHNSKSVQNIKERNIMSETGFEPVQEEKSHFLVRHSNDWAILSCFIFFSILKDLTTMQKYGGKIYQWCLKQRKWKHGLWNISFHKR